MGKGASGIFFPLYVTKGRERKRTSSWNQNILPKVAFHLQDHDISKSRKNTA